MSSLFDSSEKPTVFGLNWPGKQEAWIEAHTPTAKHFSFANFSAKTRNLLIEGDNLDALKLLLKEYKGRIKLIYIDPPYNTGSPLLYRDNFRRPELENIQAGEAPLWLRPHISWLSMMYPRLLLAREMLREDGLIFISIGDEELDSLTQIGREIFGDENFCGHLIWERKKKPSFLHAKMGRVTEFIVCFTRNYKKSPAFNIGSVTLGKKYPFNNAKNGLSTLLFPPQSVAFGCDDGDVLPQNMSSGNIITELLDPLEIRNGKNVNAFRLKGEWRYSQNRLNCLVAEGAEITIRRIPFRPNLISRSTALKKTSNLLSYRINGIPTNEDGTAELRALFGADIMSYPKPSGLLAYLINMVTDEGDIIMDFFAGSGSTAHGLWRADIATGCRRHFILVQSPEPTRRQTKQGNWKTSLAWEAGYSTIFDITKERLIRTAHALEGGHHKADLDFCQLKIVDK